ncbi:MAG: ABC transporter ATP-binding protein [Frankiaceae bacterium]|jgi:zinc/manganese transport system ATP-binding protein|nr:ABC transporter ATP-binding protein [Frankiaceae bacterium]
MSEHQRGTPIAAPGGAGEPAPVEIRGAAVAFGARTLWSGLDLRLRAGEFVAVLGVNGSGKSTLLRMILGLVAPSAGQVLVGGRPAHRARSLLGYIPQQRRLAPPAPLRARDLVGFGLDGARWGVGRPSRARRERIDAALGAVGAAHLSRRRVDQLSGGEQQRVRIAQALVADPIALLCDEPLLSLDLRTQSSAVALIDRRRRETGAAVLFVTHEINPVLPYVDRVLYLADGRFRIGSVAEVMTSASLSELFGAPIEVLRRGDRIIVIGLPEDAAHPHHHQSADPGDDPDPGLDPGDADADGNADGSADADADGGDALIEAARGASA